MAGIAGIVPGTVPGMAGYEAICVCCDWTGCEAGIDCVGTTGALGAVLFCEARSSCCAACSARAANFQTE